MSKNILMFINRFLHYIQKKLNLNGSSWLNKQYFTKAWTCNLDLKHKKI